MIKKIKVSAPGKLMLFGEHAVVYNRPCLVAAVNQRLFIEVEKILEDKILISAPEMKIPDFVIFLEELDKEQPKEVRFVLETIKNFFRKYQVESGLKIKTKSQFSTKYGFGSSSAVTVCTIKALAELFEIKMKKKEIFDLAYQTVLDIQGVGSGFDIAAAIYGGVIYFLTGGKIIEPLNVKDIPLIVGYTGLKASTSEIVKQVKLEMEKNPEYYEKLYDDIAQIVEKAKIEMENSNWQEVGRLMNKNQEILRKFKAPSVEYGVSSEIIEKLIEACLEAGAFGVKLSGAGVGDCIIALGKDKEKVAETSSHFPPRPAPQASAIEKAISQAGGTPVSVDVDYQGLKIEKIW
jgi:mevalonate kinase